MPPDLGRFAGAILGPNEYPASGWRQFAGNQLRQGGLARAISTQQAHKFPGRYGGGKLPEDSPLSVGKGHAIQLYAEAQLAPPSFGYWSLLATQIIRGAPRAVVTRPTGTSDGMRASLAIWSE